MMRIGKKMSFNQHDIVSMTFLALLSFITVHATVPPYPESQNNGTWFPIQKDRRSLRNQYNYQPKFIHSELCRHINETKCQQLDETTEQHAHRTLQMIQTKGELHVLVLLLQFQDDINRTMIPSRNINLQFNANGTNVDLFPSGSIKTYFNVISYNQFTTKASVIPWFVIPNTTAECSFNVSGLDSKFATCFTPILNALDQAHARSDNPFNWKDYDQNIDGYIDSLLVMHSGYGAEYGGPDNVEQRIWSHSNSPLAKEEQWESSVYQIQLGSYAVTSVYHGSDGTKIASIGPIAHELLHTIGLPDLYDTTNGIGSYVGGTGSYSIMSSPWGNNGNNSTLSYYPGHLDPWSKLKLGWIQPTRIRYNGNYSLRDAENYPDCFIIDTPYPTKEYLLIENRQSIQYDKDMIGSGVLIWHIDDAIVAGNSNPGYPDQNGWPENGNHYQVAVIQADGYYDLEKGINEGDEGDFFIQGRGIGPGFDVVYPNTDSYQNGNIMVTGVVISKFSRQGGGNVMSFEVTGMEDPVEPIAPPTPFPTMAVTDESRNDTAQCLVNVNTKLCAANLVNVSISDDDCECYNFCPNGTPQGCVRAGEMPVINCQNGPLIAGCQPTEVGGDSTNGLEFGGQAEEDDDEEDIVWDDGASTGIPCFHILVLLVMVTLGELFVW